MPGGGPKRSLSRRAVSPGGSAARAACRHSGEPRLCWSRTLMSPVPGCSPSASSDWAPNPEGPAPKTGPPTATTSATRLRSSIPKVRLVNWLAWRAWRIPVLSKALAPGPIWSSKRARNYWARFPRINGHPGFISPSPARTPSSSLSLIRITPGRWKLPPHARGHGAGAPRRCRAVCALHRTEAGCPRVRLCLAGSMAIASRPSAQPDPLWLRLRIEALR